MSLIAKIVVKFANYLKIHVKMRLYSKRRLVLMPDIDHLKNEYQHSRPHISLLTPNGRVYLIAGWLFRYM